MCNQKKFLRKRKSICEQTVVIVNEFSNLNAIEIVLFIYFIIFFLFGIYKFKMPRVEDYLDHRDI